MPLLLDSKDIFDKKAKQMGFSEQQLVSLHAQGMNSIGDAGFVVALDAPDANTQIAKVAEKVYGPNPLP
eukprot:1854014-Amphidinium_carterae.1